MSGELVALGALCVFIAIVAWRARRIGTVYIEYRATDYYPYAVWRDTFTGTFPQLLGIYATREKAEDKAFAVRANPPGRVG